ncbi:hypothetical protein F511_17201 [Dorcoceras hygrometricum]|uniref:Uncharacterized protein n=1 Tax=Dorcoceras hygrometricum TaxID=472368 RepID=A0A2Z7DAM8_9LAMI|nr:hypothetical protein F511_17201 [Dorcoceras hygrometricum]
MNIVCAAVYPSVQSLLASVACQPSQLGGFSDTTNQLVTTPMIALNLSGTTHLSASHNVALSQILLRHDSFNCSNCFLTGHGTHNRRNCPGAKSVKASQYSAQILASTTYCLWSRTQIWFYLSQQLLTARTKLKTARNTYREAHTHMRTLYSTVVKTHQLTASSRFLFNVEPGFLTGINRKSYSRRSHCHQSRSKQRRKSTEIYRRRVRMNSNYRGFTGENDEEYRVQNTLSVEQQLLSPSTGYADMVQVSKQVINSTENDVAPTNQDDVA